MALETGSATLQDIGQLSYNGVRFAALYTSSMSGNSVMDASGRTVKYVEYTLTVDGYVTLDDDVDDQSTDRIMQNLRLKLQVAGGTLTYTGKGFGAPFVVNNPGGGAGTVRDVAWGPKPKVLEFIPLGASRSAKIKWTCTTCIPEFAAPIRVGRRVLQFNQDNTISYDEDGYSTVTYSGTLEIPLTRIAQDDRTLTETVNNFREQYMTRIANSINLERFRVVKRDFKISRDARTMDWVFAVEELPPMGIPAGMMTAHGSYSVRPEKPGATIVQWIATLRGTYTLPKTVARRTAYQAFMIMWMFRMNQSQLGNVPLAPVPAVAPNGVVAIGGVNAGVAFGQWLFGNTPGQSLPVGGAAASAFPPQIQNGGVQAVNPNAQKAIPISFSIDEGLYLDSKTISFEASWRLFSTLDRLLQATGIWRKSGIEGEPLWAASIRNISGWGSWLRNQVDPNSFVIVDFGS